MRITKKHQKYLVEVEVFDEDENYAFYFPEYPTAIEQLIDAEYGDCECCRKRFCT